MAGSRSVVLAALLANGAIAVLKFLAWLLTGSPSMLSETYHSVSDTGNQVFLLVGISYAGREADRTHPFGYGKAQFFYAFLVAVLLFGIAGWESLKHGIEAVRRRGEHVATASATATQQATNVPTTRRVAVSLVAIGTQTDARVRAVTEGGAQGGTYGRAGPGRGSPPLPRCGAGVRRDGRLWGVTPGSGVDTPACRRATRVEITNSTGGVVVSVPTLDGKRTGETPVLSEKRRTTRAHDPNRETFSVGAPPRQSVAKSGLRRRPCSSPRCGL